MQDQDEMKEIIVGLHRKGDWKGVVQLYENSKSLLTTDRIILWFQPSEKALAFLKENLKGVSGLLSIGCGTGLLEWLIICATGLPVIGYEIDSAWWESKYSPPKFLGNNVICISPSELPSLNPNHALLFCYFNNLAAFEIYLQHFTGQYVVLIGPNRQGTGRFCDPEPFYLQNHRSDEWLVHSTWSSLDDDAIVIYKRI